MTSNYDDFQDLVNNKEIANSYTISIPILNVRVQILNLPEYYPAGILKIGRRLNSGDRILLRYIYVSL
jgi:hypothetical protein